MSEVWDATDSLLSDRPEVESKLQHLLKIDAQQETWTFDEIDVDSGMFGELVSRGIIEKTDDEYQVADPAAVRAALNGESVTRGATSEPAVDLSALLPPRQAVLPFLGSLGLVLIFRLLAFTSVFRGSDVVLLGNDPYYYRYWLFEFLQQGTSVTDLPSGAEVGEPLMLSTLLGVTKLFGASVSAAEFVLAWYPVGSALITATIAYLIAIRLTGNRRIALAAVVLLAVTPVHAFRTAIGYADHHAFDFIWLTLTSLAALEIVRSESPTLSGRLQTPSTLGWVGVLGIGIGAQVLSWNAGPLLLLPLAFYGVARTVTAVKHESSPLIDLPLALGVALGGMLSVLGYLVLGWQQPYIVATPFVLALGLGLVFGTGELARRQQFSSKAVTGGIIVIGGLVLGIAFFVIPEFSTQFIQEINRLVFGNGEGIAEVKSIFSPAYGTVTGPFFFFGLALFFTLGYLARSLYAAWTTESPSWLLVGSYTTVLFALALLQVRFAGELAVFAAIFSGIALVDLAAITGAGERVEFRPQSGRQPGQQSDFESEALLRIPGRQTVFVIGAIFLLIGGLGMLMTPLRVNALAVDDNTYDAAVWMESYSEDRGWEYPENYVFSPWSDNRVYNAFVSNESRSYRFAQSRYDEFVTSTDGQKWATSLDGRAGFIVVNSNSGYNQSMENTMYHRLSEEFGSHTSHYRLVWMSADESKKVFTIVPGAQVAGRDEPNTRVVAHASTTVNGETVNHTYTTQTNQTGQYTLRIPQPGTYTVQNETVVVSEEDVEHGKIVTIAAD